MSDAPDAAHILFPNDAPTKVVPEWFTVQRAAAEQRLAGMGDPAAAMFPNEKPKGEIDKPAGDDADPASVMFKDDAGKFDAAPVSEFFNGFAVSAAADGDIDRSHELQAAGDALVADFKSAGADAAELSAALDIVKERQGDTISDIAPEKIEAEMSTGLAALADEGVTNADLDLARRFVADLEIVAPGTIASLERTGAGNDLRLVRAAIKEAKRRNYGAAR